VLRECSREVLRASILEMCFVRVFLRSASSECSGDLLGASVLLECFVRVLWRSVCASVLAESFVPVIV
jgi:hypothetical protein